MNLYQYSSCAQALRDAIEEKKAFDPGFTFQNVAMQAGVQKSFLSNVLHGRAWLNEDQACRIASILGWDSEQSEFFELMVALERSDYKRRKEELRKRLEKIRTKHLSTESNVSATVVRKSGADIERYYLDPLNQLVHIGLTIPKFKKEPKKLIEALGLGKKKFYEIVQRLESFGILQLESNKINVKIETIHLSPDSELIQSWKSQLRLATLQFLQSKLDENDYSMSVVFATTQKQVVDFRFEYLKLIEKLQKDVIESEAENIYQLNFDLYSITQ